MLGNVSGGVGRSAWAIDHAFKTAFMAAVRGREVAASLYMRFLRASKEPTQDASSTTATIESFLC